MRALHEVSLTPLAGQGLGWPGSCQTFCRARVQEGMGTLLTQGWTEQHCRSQASLAWDAGEKGTLLM